MKFIKKILFKILSQEAYLKVLHRSFYFLYNLGVLKKNPSFKYHYKIQELIEPDFTIVDIGANLGYFSKNFAKLAKRGKVISIEPVPVFYHTLEYFLGNYVNVTIYNVALGNEPGQIKMVLPEQDGMIRTGLPHIAKSSEELNANKNIEVCVIQGSKLLGELAKIDYLKCDIEGYEWNVFQEIKEVIRTKRPMIQLEIAHENIEHFMGYFNELDYSQYGIADFKFIKESGKQQEEGDFLFVPNEKVPEFDAKHLIHV